MNDKDFLLHQFITLRDEIAATKRRIFWIVAMGLFGVPIITYLAESLRTAGLTQAQFVTPMIPYLVLVLIVMFIAEHTALMRAGQYIRQHVEPKVSEFLSWEAWLEKNASTRLLDKHFFAVFLLVFFVYYFLSIGFAIRGLLGEAAAEPARMWWLIAAIVTYGIGAVWALSTLLHHWKSATRTSFEE